MKNYSTKYLWFSMILSAYFLMLFLLFYFNVEATIIGVFGEMVTLPLMLAQGVLLCYLLMKVVNESFRTIPNLLALIISLATTIIIIQSF